MSLLSTEFERWKSTNFPQDALWDLKLCIRTQLISCVMRDKYLRKRNHSWNFWAGSSRSYSIAISSAHSLSFHLHLEWKPKHLIYRKFSTCNQKHLFQKHLYCAYFHHEWTSMISWKIILMKHKIQCKQGGHSFYLATASKCIKNNVL